MAETLVKRNAELTDTINEIVKTINNEYGNSFIKLCVLKLGANGNTYQFIKNVFDYVCRNVDYKLDGNEWDAVQQKMVPHEVVNRPQTTVVNKIGDCKKMTVLIASILKAAGINVLIKHVYYMDKPFTHVYVIVPYPAMPNYLTVDPVNDKKWNQEVQYDYGYLYDLNGNKIMNLYTAGKPNFTTNFKSNVNQTAGNFYSSMQRVGSNILPPADRNKLIDDLLEISGCPTMGRGKLREKIKDKLDKIKDKLKEVAAKGGLAPMRGAFLLLVKLNPFRLANKLANAWKINKNATEGFWSKVGGNINEFKNAVAEGGSKHPMRGIAGTIGAVTITAATIALATPVLVAAVKLIKDLKAAGGEAGEDELDELTDKALDATNTTPLPNIHAVITPVVNSRADTSPTDDATKPPVFLSGGFDAVTAFDKKNLINTFVKAPLYIFAAVTLCVSHPYIFIAICVFGTADMIGINKFRLTKKS